MVLITYCRQHSKIPEQRFCTFSEETKKKKKKKKKNNNNNNFALRMAHKVCLKHLHSGSEYDSYQCNVTFKVLTSCSLNEPRHDKTNKVTVRPAKTQIRLGFRPV